MAKTENKLDGKPQILNPKQTERREREREREEGGDNA
jgi:hypothetical protein